MADGRAGVLLTPPEQHWACVCGRTATTRIAGPHTQLHRCPRLRGLLTPYVPVPPSWQPGDPVRAGLTAHVREDVERHSGLREAGPGVSETLERDDAGRPHFAVSVEHDGGTQWALFVPGINMDLRLA